MYDQSKENPGMTFLLSLLDGTLPLPGSMFILTSNSSQLHSALVGRPSRIFFLRYYGGLSESLILDYCREKNLPNEVIEDIIDLAISRGDLFTFDMLMSIVKYQLWHNSHFKAFASSKDIRTYFNTGEAKSVTRASSWRSALDLILKSGARRPLRWTIKADSGLKLLKNSNSAVWTFEPCSFNIAYYHCRVTGYDLTDSLVRGVCDMRRVYTDTLDRIFSDFSCDAINIMYNALLKSHPDTTPKLSSEYEDFDSGWELEDKIKMLPFLIRVKGMNTPFILERLNTLKFLGTWLMEATDCDDLAAICSLEWKEDSPWNVPFEAEAFTPEPTTTHKSYTF